MKNQYNYLLPTLMAVIFYNYSYSQCKSDLEKENIKGNVEKIIETGINVKDGKNEINHIKTTIFDKRGKALGYNFASKFDSLKPTETIFEIDKEGNKIKENRYDLSSKIRNYLIYEFDSLGNEIKSSYYTSGGNLDSYTCYKYNLACEKIEAKTFFSDGGLWLWYKFTIKDGKLIEVFDLQDSTISKITNDIQNNNIKHVKYDKYGTEKKVSVYNYVYDEKSNWIKKRYM
jgi:hypothetical protein